MQRRAAHRLEVDELPERRGQQGSYHGSPLRDVAGKRAVNHASLAVRAPARPPQMVVSRLSVAQNSAIAHQVIIKFANASNNHVQAKRRMCARAHILSKSQPRTVRTTHTSLNYYKNYGIESNHHS